MGESFKCPGKIYRIINVSDSLCLKYGYTICKKRKSFDGGQREGIVSNVMKKFQMLSRTDDTKIKSYVRDTAAAVQESMEQAFSREDFIKQMEKRGYQTDWRDSRKYITFTNADGKKVRNSNLQKTFGMKVSKEELAEYFKGKKIAAEKKHGARHRKR